MARGYPVANPDDAVWTKHKYLFSFGAYGEVKVIAFGSWEGYALEEAEDWLAEHAPGVFYTSSWAELQHDAAADGVDPDDEEAVWEWANTDMEVVGHTTYPNLKSFVAIPAWEIHVEELPWSGRR